MRLLNPLFEFVHVEAVLICLEGCLQGYIEDPVLLLVASSDEVDGLPCLKDLLGKRIGEKGWDHNVV